jgi:hypothetical protein
MGLINSQRGIQKSVARQIQAPPPDKCPKNSKQPRVMNKAEAAKRRVVEIFTFTPLLHHHAKASFYT